MGDDIDPITGKWTTTDKLVNRYGSGYLARIGEIRKKHVVSNIPSTPSGNIIIPIGILLSVLLLVFGCIGLFYLL